MQKMMLAVAGLLCLALSACVSKSPAGKPAEYHYQMGLSYLGERNYSSALQELVEAEKLEPDNPDMLYAIGRAYMGKHRPDLAEQKFIKVLKIKPNYSAVRNDLGVVQLDLKKWDSAIQQFTIVKDDLLYEQHDNAAVNLGLAYLGKGDYAKAFEELNAMKTFSPRNPVVRVALGRVLATQDNTTQAIAEFKKAIEIYPDYAAAHYYLGIALMKSNLVASRAEFREAVRIMPDSEIGRSSMEYLDLLK